jgi:hypothetical protein
MNYEHRQVANSILSRFKDGEEFSQSVIRTALIDAGDLAPDRSKGLDQAVQKKIKEEGKAEALAWWHQTLMT